MNGVNEVYYTRCVIALAETIPVTTSQAIFSVTGIKLVNPGVRLNSTFFDRFAQQNLLPPLEQCLQVQGGVDHAALLQLASEMLQQDGALQRAASTLPDVAAWLHPLSKINLCEPVVFLLTLAREQRPALLQHSVLVALLSIYLGMRMGMSLQHLTLLASAGLFHDLGELRIDERLFAGQHKPGPGQRRMLRTHPAISQHILLNTAAYPLELLQAVAQHHERMDGSGYPFGMAGSEMNRYGRILSIAEAVANKLDERQSASALEFMLKLNSHQFDEHLLRIMLGLFGHSSPPRVQRAPTLQAASVPRLHEEIGKFGLAINYWQRLLDVTPPPRGPAAFIQQRLGKLAFVTRAAGINPADKLSLTAGIEHDADSLAEVEQLSNEVLQQVREIMFEVQRRWPDFAADNSPVGEVVRGWMEHMGELLLTAEERVLPE
ncbi:MAG TPA: HD domain-containing phosphohydrolase [Gallionellaceae bacterium]|nr:HD domain-containing phosphohydrolase [Gallionellaceae bacterium]